MDMPAGLNPAESEAVIGADDPDGAGAREVTFSYGFVNILNFCSTLANKLTMR